MGARFSMATTILATPKECIDPYGIPPILGDPNQAVP